MTSQPIAVSANSCLSAFQELLSGQVTTENEKIEQQLARFNFWAANIGVFAPSRASLDTRLSSRGGIKYRPLILQLLNVLEKNLRNVGTPGSKHAANDGNADDEYISSSDSIQAVQDLIDRLHRLSALIRKSAVRDRNSKAANFVERDEDGNDLSVTFESNALRIIQQRYPDASEPLCGRLGKSVSLRRKRVLYSRKHQVKLAKRVPLLDPAPVVPENPAGPLLPRTLEDPVTQEKLLASGPLPEVPVTIALSVGPSETAASVPDSDVQSTIAPSRASSASTGSMLQDQGLRYPRPPKIDALMSEASCPYCSAVLTLEESSNLKSWRRHVKRDIEPYICVADSCQSNNSHFNNFKQWVMHMQQEHRVQWHCSLPVHPPISFNEKAQFEEHMLRDHKGKYHPSRLSTLAKVASRPALRPFDECPLCKIVSDDIGTIEGHHQVLGGPDRLARHVAGHLKSLALIFLPPGADDTGDETEGEDSSSNEPSLRTVNSKDSIFEAPLTFEDDGQDPPPLAPSSEADDADWSILAKPQEFNPEIDPALQSFVKRVHPQLRWRDPSRMQEDWATFYKLTIGEIEGIDKLEIRRQNALHEIVTSEDNYLQQLEVLRTVYRDGLESMNPPIISRNKFPKFIRSIFGGIDELKLVHEVYLLHPIYERQDLEGPWISGFSDIFGDWLKAARKPYLNYYAGFPYASYLVRREADKNLLFRQFLEDCAHLSSRRLDWNAHLRAPITRIQRYCLQLNYVQKSSQYADEEPEKARLSAVIDDLKSFVLELDGVIDENSKRVELIELQNQIYLRPGMEDKVKLNLDHPGRELMFKGDLEREGPNRFTWLSTHVILFDHYLILAKSLARQETAAGPRREFYDVSKLPIPIQLLVVLLGDDGPMVVKSSVKGIGSTTSTPTPKRAVSAIESHSQMSDIESGPENAMYPFSIGHLGLAEKYVLYAPTAHNRREWCDKIREAQERYASALTSRNANPFRLKVLSTNSADLLLRHDVWMRRRLGRIRGSPLDCALNEEPPSVVLNSSDLNMLCADTYTQNGSKTLVVGTEKGIYILKEAVNGDRRWDLRVEMTQVTQIAVVDLPAYQLCLFVGNKSLWAIRLEALFTDPVPAHYIVPRKISGVREVKSFATFHGIGNFLVFHKQPSPIPLQPPSLKILEAIPVHQALWTSKTPSAFNRLLGGSANISGLFRDLGSVHTPRDFTNISILRPPITRPFVALCDSVGFNIIRIMDPVRSTESEQILNRVSTSEPHVVPLIDTNIKGQTPLGMFLLSTTNSRLLCYPACAVYLDMDTTRRHDNIMHFLCPANSAAIYKKYLVLFHEDFVEIRDIFSGKLKQVIYGQDIRCLDDGNRGPNTPGPERTVKFGMAHPGERGYLVLEMLLDESFVDAEPVVESRSLHSLVKAAARSMEPPTIP